VSNFEHFSDAKIPVYRFISFEGRPSRQAAPSTQPIDDKNHERNHRQQMDEASADVQTEFPEATRILELRKWSKA
jgi:hypothetical protein